MRVRYSLIALLLFVTAVLGADVIVYVYGTGTPTWGEVGLKVPGTQYYESATLPGVVRFNVDLDDGDLIKAYTELNGVCYYSAITPYTSPQTILTIVLP